MPARLMLNERHVLAESAFAEIVVWQLDAPTLRSRHIYKYRLALVVNNKCVVRYDNEAGKGDHKHVGERESRYVFVSPRVLLEDFWKDVKKWRF